MIYAITKEGILIEKLIYGRNGQVRFDTVEEKKTAIEYILTSPNVDFTIHENNQNQGAWGPEDRIHFRGAAGVPDCLKKIMTAGRGRMFGRINCKEFCEEIRAEAKRRVK